MYHRYGRHGPAAWLRWYRRKYHSRLPVPVSTTIGVEVEITIYVERILIVMALYEDESQGENINRNLQPLHPQQPYALPEHLRAEIDQIRGAGRIQGKITAREDVKTRADDLPSAQEVENTATTEALKKIKEVMDKGLRVDDAAEEYLTQEYTEAFIVAYQAQMSESERNGYVPDANKRAIRQAARSDKDYYNAQNVRLQPEFVRYLAMARALRQKALDNRPSINELEAIHEYVGSYCTFYQQYNPGEAGRPSRPDFL